MQIDKIYHLADLHIRNYQRHKEYREVFQKFLDNVDSDGLLNSIIYIAGDIAHAKTDMSPELVSEISWFLTECANRRETVIITGNHDCNLNNSSRLDVLTPIVENLNNDKIHYLRDTGIYNIHNLTFVVYSILDNKENWPKASEVSGENKIVLFHGPVNKAKTDIGYTVSSDSFQVDMFDGFDMALLGDIHKRQTFGEGYEWVAYVGSLVQQNHGELLENHGYLIWDVPTRTFTEHHIHNEYGYLTIDVDNGKIPDWVLTEANSKLPKKPRVRLRYSNTDQSKLNDVIKELRGIFNIQELTITRTDTIAKLGSKAGINTDIIGNVRDLDYQNKLLKDYLELNIFTSAPEIEEILKINTENHSTLDHSNFAENIVWIPKTFEFSNMFSYGDSNLVRFDKANGIIGIFAPNASGKSSLFDALAFCIFDKTSRTNISKNILNNQREDFQCKFNFEIDGVDYFIERSAKWTRAKKNLKVDVSFWRETDGKIESLNGEQRRETNRNIERYLGKFEDFILTTMSLQGNHSLFVDKSQSERKDILSQFIGLDIFEKLYNSALDENRGNSVLIKKFKSDDLVGKLTIVDDEITSAQSEYNTTKDKSEKLQEQIEVVQSNIEKLQKKLHQIPNDNLDIDNLREQLDDKELVLHDVESNILELTDELDDITKKRNTLSNKLKDYDVDVLSDKVKLLTETETLLHALDSELKFIVDKIDDKSKLIAKLKSHRYNETCEICIENSKSILDSLTEEQNLLNKLYDEQTSKNDDITKLKNNVKENLQYKEIWKEYLTLSENFQSTELHISKIESKIDKEELFKLKVLSKIGELDTLITEYNSNSDKIKENQEIHQKITKIKNEELSGLKNELKAVESKLLKDNGNLSTLLNQKKTLEDRIREVEELEHRNNLYDLYLSAISKNGIPYKLIETALPKIEGEINNILGQIVDFGIELEADDKNINANLIRNDRRWSLEMCSGMERFISGLAIRVALINVCNLPRPNFLILDEGFGTLDSENLQSLYSLFDYLKTQFDFVMIISHIDSMRDMVDSSIDIEKINGFSKIKY